MATYKPLLSLWDKDGNQLKDGVIPLGWVQRGSWSEPVEVTVWNNKATQAIIDDPASTKLLVSWPDAVNVVISATDDAGQASDRFEQAPHWLWVSVCTRSTDPTIADTWSAYVPVVTGTPLFSLLKGTAYSPATPTSQDNNWGTIRLRALVPPDAPMNENFNFKVKLGSTAGPTDAPSPEATAAGVVNYENM